MKLFQKISKKRFLITGIMVFVFFATSVFYFILNVSAESLSIIPSFKSDATSDFVAPSILPELPIRIKIPKIGIDSIVEHVGLTEGGAVGSPVGPNNTAWFIESPIPGSIGSSIIDGHSGWKNNKPAIFDNLGKLKKGDEIYIESRGGIITTFVVRELKIYDKNDIALDVFNSSDNKSHLNLITCTGIWNTIENGHDSRIVVFADLVDIE